MPSLREMLAEASLAPDLMLGVPVSVAEPESEGERYELEREDRHEVPVCNDKNVWRWRVDSLRELFRGDRQPRVLGDYPEAYQDVFYLLDRHVLEQSCDRRPAGCGAERNFLRAASPTGWAQPGHDA